jgi:protein TonB
MGSRLLRGTLHGCGTIAATAAPQEPETMIRLVLSTLALALVAGCATNEPQNEPQYQVGLAGSRQAKSEAERTHARGSLRLDATAASDSDPKVLSPRFPDYPPDLQRAGIEGQVVVRFTVEPDGSVSEPAVQGSPPAQLAALALDAIRQWKFVPAMKNGTPVRARLQQPFLFRLE